MRLLLALVVIAASTTLVGGQTASSGEFDQEYARLKKGRDYTSRKTGRIDLPSPDRGLLLDNVLEVPADYDPARTWPLRVALHGGVGRTPPDPDEKPARPLSNRIPSAGELVLHPRAWSGSEWWAWQQVANITTLVNRVRRDYNVDESRTYVTGISDGGTGVYYLALKEPNLWSSYLPLNGSIAVIRHPDNGADGEMYGNNLANAPLYVVNGENDPLYPVSQVEPHITWFQALGVPHVFRPQAGAGHNTAWWPTERDPFEKFVREHARVAHPAKLSWETERVDKFNRIRWLVINELRQDAGRDTTLKDMGFFQHTKRSGRVDVVRTGNAFEAKTRDVAAFTLLLSPDAIDFSKLVTVTVNGKPAFSGLVTRDAATLLRWSARDNDRTMLYGAELRIAP